MGLSPRPQGSAPGDRRPVLIAQSSPFNESPIRTVVIVAITSNLRLPAAPRNVLCRPRDTGPARDSVVNVSQMLTVDESFLMEHFRALPERILA